MMETVPHVTSGLGLRKFQGDEILFDRVYMYCLITNMFVYIKEPRHTS